MISSDRLLMPELKYCFLTQAQGILERNIHMQQKLFSSSATMQSLQLC